MTLVEAQCAAAGCLPGQGGLLRWPWPRIRPGCCRPAQPARPPPVKSDAVAHAYRDSCTWSAPRPVRQLSVRLNSTGQAARQRARQDMPLTAVRPAGCAHLSDERGQLARPHVVPVVLYQWLVAPAKAQQARRKHAARGRERRHRVPPAHPSQHGRLAECRLTGDSPAWLSGASAHPLAVARPAPRPALQDRHTAQPASKQTSTHQ